MFGRNRDQVKSDKSLRRCDKGETSLTQLHTDVWKLNWKACLGGCDTEYEYIMWTGKLHMLQHTSLMICISTEHEIFGLSMHVICR